MKNRRFVDCTDTLCCVRDLADGEDPLDYQRNRFCLRCLEDNYGYEGEDCIPATFVCPRCKGMENPNKRARTAAPRPARPAKRVNHAEVEGQLVLVAHPPTGPESPLTPALRVFSHGLKEYLRALTPAQKQQIQETMPAIAPMLVGLVGGLTDSIKQEGSGSGDGGSGDGNDGLPARDTAHAPGSSAAAGNADAVTASEAEEFAPFLLIFGAQDSAMDFVVVPTGSFTSTPRPFEWTQEVVEMFMNASDADASNFASKEHQRRWVYFTEMYGENLPVARVKSFTSRRAWKCPLQTLQTLPPLPPLQVSLDIAACPAQFQAAIAEKRGSMRPLRKRVRSEAGGGRGGDERRSDTRAGGGRYRGGGGGHRASDVVRATIMNIVPQKAPLTTGDAKQISWCTLPPPQLPPEPPAGTAMGFKIETGNVVRLDVTKGMSAADRRYVMSLCDNPDVTLILKGLTGQLTQAKWTWDYLLARAGHVVWKKVRVYEKKDPNSEHWHEKGWRTMSLRDYYEYLQRRAAGDPAALSVVWYWIDFPMKEFLPELSQDFQRKSPIDLFPGGMYCAQRWVTASARPDMGPNLYISPPGGRTWFHEDGHGTVDSGHQCLSGQNEVIMLRRITDEPSRLNALHALNSGDVLDNARPHDDATQLTAEKPWPTQKTLDYLRDELNAGPSTLVLGPGEFIHINKGRLHAFRKKAPKRPETVDDVCISVAWDWMFEGAESNGLRGEAATAAFNKEQNRLFQRQSLGIYGSTMVHGALARLGELRATEAIHKSQVRSLLGQYVAGRAGSGPRSEVEAAVATAGSQQSQLQAKCAAIEPYVSMLEDQESAFKQAEDEDFRCASLYDTRCSSYKTEAGCC
jgi:hypothetical protein